MAAAAAAKNLLRTYSRRYNREHTFGAGINMVDNGTTHSAFVSHFEDPQPWEDSLRSDAPLSDQVLEMKESLGIAAEIPELFEMLAYG